MLAIVEDNPVDALHTCEALTAMLQEFLCDRTELELGEKAIYGMWIILEAQRKVLASV